MKKSQIGIGETYLAKVSGKLVQVRIIRESVYGGWLAINLSTGREVRIKTAARLHDWWTKPGEPESDMERARR
jgi:hypothetical protein